MYLDYTISIHAPLAGSDPDASGRQRRLPISIHAPLAGSDLLQTSMFFRYLQFQSTLPLRGATQSDGRFHTYTGFQSTLPLRGATQSILHQHQRFRISIHAPLAGSDSKSAQKLSIFHDFCPKHVPISETRLSTIHEFSKFYLLYIVNYCLYPVRKNLQKYVSSPFAPENLQYRYHNIKIPSGSYDFFAPMCSILLLYLSPIK